MRDTGLYRYFLGIEPPWMVERIKMDLVNQRVDLCANYEEDLRWPCPEHGVWQVRLPWADAKARFTLLFERLAIDVLLESDILGATRILRISWDEAWHILERAIERGLMGKEEQICTRIGVDEKSIGKGHTYMTLGCDFGGFHDGIYCGGSEADEPGGLF